MENEVEVGYSQHTAGANGLITSADCIGNPNQVCIEANVFAPNAVIYERDPMTNYATIVWLNTGTTAVPSWTQKSSGALFTTMVQLTTAQILALNTTPIALLPALAVGQVYQVISVTTETIFNSVAYATNTELDIVDTTLGTVLFKDTATTLAAAATKIVQVEPSINANAGLAITNGGGVSAKAAAGNPTAGNSPVNVYVTARIITL